MVILFIASIVVIEVVIAIMAIVVNVVIVVIVVFTPRSPKWYLMSCYGGLRYADMSLTRCRPYLAPKSRDFTV